MNRYWALANLFLSLLLGVLLLQQLGGTPARAAIRDARPAAGAQPAAAESLSLQLRAVAGEPHQLDLLFPTPMVEAAAQRRPWPDPPLRFEPAAEFTAQWQSADHLRIHLIRPGREPRMFALHLLRELEAVDGRKVAAGTQLSFACQPLRVRGLALAEAADPDRPELRLGLSARVEPKLLASRLSIAAEGAALDFEVDPQPRREAGDAAVVGYRIRLRQATRARHLELRLPAGFGPKPMALGLARPWSKKLALRQELQLLRLRPERRRIRLDFGRSLPLPAPGMIRLEPSQPFQVRRSYQGLTLLGTFAPGTALRLHLVGGFPGRGRARLVDALQRSVLIPPPAPVLELPQTGQTLSSKAEPALTLRGFGVPRIGVALRRLYDNNALHFHRQGRWDLDGHFAPAVERWLQPRLGRDGRFEQRLDLADLLPGPLQGIYHLRVWDAAGRARSRSRVFQVTDLRVGLRRCGPSLAVLATRIADGRPVADAEVQVITPSNQGLVFGKTDAEGMALLELPAGAADRQPRLVMLRKGAERAFVDLETHATELNDAGLEGAEFLAAGDVEAYLATGRGVLRPGGTLHGSVLVRDAAGRAPADRKMELRVLAPGGRMFRRQPLPVTGTGFGSWQLQLPDTAPTGTWRLQVWDLVAEPRLVGRRPVLVQAFVPERLEVSARLPSKPGLGAICRIRVRGAWLDGSPAAGRPVRVRLRLEAGECAIEGGADWHFETLARREALGALPALEGQLDARGEAEFSQRLPRLPESQGARLRVEVELLDPSGRAVTCTLVESVSQTGALLGLRAAGGKLTWTCLRADGEAVPLPAGWQLALERRHWAWRRVEREGHWRYQSRIEAEERFRQALRPEVRELDLRQVMAEPGDVEDGWWVAVARRQGRRIELPLTGSPLRPDRLRIRPLGLAAGGRARLELVSPVAGRCWLVLQGRRIHRTCCEEVPAGRSELEIEVPAGLRHPNLHVVAVLSRGIAKPGSAAAGVAWLQGACAVPLDRDDRRCAVQLELPDLLRPKSALRVKVQAAGARDLALFVVDQGVRNITGHRDPDPQRCFLARRQLRGAGADTGAGLLSGQRFRTKTETGGDGGEGLDLRALQGSMSSEIRPLALFRRLRLDAAGRAEVHIPLPAYQGRLRVMAVASGARVSGAAAADLRVQALLGLRLATPRILRVGDRCEVPLTLSYNLPTPAVVQFRVQRAAGVAGGPSALGLPARLEVRPGQTPSLPLRLEAAPGARQVHLQIEVRCGEQRDLLDCRVPVQGVTSFSQRRQALWLAEPTRLDFGPGWEREGFRLRLRVDSSPELALEPSLRSLLQYPHGCLEQTTSKARALLACQDLLPRILGAQAPDVEGLLQAGVDRILGMQLRRGGFGWWPGARREYDHGTVQAAQFLLAARARGIRVDAQALDRALDRVQAYVGQSRRPASLRSYALWVLAAAGRPIQPYADGLALEALGTEARLCLALALVGHRPAAELRALCAAAESGPGGGAAQPYRFLSSLPRLRAWQLRLALRLGADGDALLGQVQALQAELLDPSRRNTQELGHGLVALAQYYRTRPRASQAGFVELRQGARRQRIPSGRSATLAWDPGQAIELRPSPGATLAVSLHWSGQARPQTESAPRDWEVGLELLDPATGLRATRFRQGRVYEAKIQLQLKQRVENLLLTQVLPAGFELELPRPGESAQLAGSAPAHHVERRDDRILIFVPGALRGEAEYRFRLRAVFPGRFQAPGLRVESMYEPALRFQAASVAAVEVLR